MLSSTHFCDHCGAANRPHAIFCVSCGKRQTLAGGQASTSLTGLLVAHHLLKQRYHIISQLGQGGFGAVYKAEDTLFGNALRAVKEMSQSGLETQELNGGYGAFKREGFLPGGLVDPNLPRIYDHFHDGGRWYLVMDYIEGETLEARLNTASGGKLPIEEVLNIGIQLSTVLNYLHTHQPPIIFRDLKPTNVMMSVDGHLYLIDFGIARLFTPGKAKDTLILGSPGYAASEQYGKAQTTASADIYSLGATLHQLVSGNDPSQNPFQFAPLGLGSQPGLASLETLIMQMVETNKDKRPSSMAAVKQELQRIATQPMTAPPSGTAIGASIPSPKTKEQWLDEGNVLYGLKRYGEALAAYDQAIRLDPNLAMAYVNKGNVLSDLKHYGEALAAYDQAIRLDPNLAMAYVNKGRALNELKRYGEALAILDQAIGLDPNNAFAYATKGYALNGLNRYWEALAAYDQAIGLDPNNAFAYLNKGNSFYYLKRPWEALADYDQAIRLDPTLALAYHNKGNVLNDLKRYGEAKAAYSQAIRLGYSGWDQDD